MDLISTLFDMGVDTVMSVFDPDKFDLLDLPAIVDEKQKTYKVVLDKRSDYEVFMPILMEAGLITANRRIQMQYLRVNGYM